MQICPHYVIEKLTKAISAFSQAQKAEGTKFHTDKIAYLKKSKQLLKSAMKEISYELHYEENKGTNDK